MNKWIITGSAMFIGLMTSVGTLWADQGALLQDVESVVNQVPSNETLPNLTNSEDPTSTAPSDDSSGSSSKPSAKKSKKTKSSKPKQSKAKKSKKPKAPKKSKSSKSKKKSKKAA